MSAKVANWIKKSLKRVYVRLMSRESMYYINFWIYKMALNSLGVLNYEDLDISGERTFVKEYLSEEESPIVFDVGANIGEYSRIVHDANPTSQVFAFEPHPSSFGKLKEVSHHNTHVYNLAVGQNNEVKTLKDRSQDGSKHASFIDEYQKGEGKGKEYKFDVNVIKIDEFVKRKDLPYIDLLKIDVEGFELSVLKGAMNTIEQEKIRCVQFEFGKMNAYSGVFVRDYMEILSDYTFFRLLPSSMISIDNYSPLECEIFAYQNIVAVHKSRIDNVL